jgi:hypothetical protein
MQGRYWFHRSIKTHIDKSKGRVPFLLAVVLSVLRFTDSDYPIGIFKFCFFYFYAIQKTQLTLLSILDPSNIFIQVYQAGWSGRQMFRTAKIA